MAVRLAYTFGYASKANEMGLEVEESVLQYAAEADSFNVRLMIQTLI